MPAKHETDQIRRLSTGALAVLCERETTKYFQRAAHDPRFCFELFRRASEHDDQRAWEILYQQYHALIHGWVVRHPAFNQRREQPEHYVSLAIEKLWAALRGDRFQRFSDLPSILAYLKRCVTTTLIDDARKRQFEEVAIELVEGPSALQDSAPDPALIYQRRASQQELWAYVQECVKGDAESIVLYDSFVLALKPNEILGRHTDVFGTIDDVYRVKQNMMNRFRRDAKISKWVEFDD